MKQLTELPFVEDIQALGGEIYSVGGAVRDELLGKESKDLDVLVCKVTYEQLIPILEKYGQVDLVGKSFGIIKFTPDGESEAIDVALPRTERKTGEGHKGFEITVDPFLPLKEDLRRRDFTINAMAKDILGQIHDPFKGMLDLGKGVIRHVDEKAFSDDPLRMLRAVQFGSRFKFKIAKDTLTMIINNGSTIKEIAKERIYEEFKKIIAKGDVEYAMDLMELTKLEEHIFTPGHKSRIPEIRKNATTMGELMYLYYGNYWTPDQAFKDDFGDRQVVKEMQALQIMLYSRYQRVWNQLVTFFRAAGVYPEILQTKVLTGHHSGDTLTSYLKGDLPKNLGEVNIDGSELLRMGLDGPPVGNMFKMIVRHIMSGRLKNENKAIKEFVKSKM